jgi:hypothetical protein
MVAFDRMYTSRVIFLKFKHHMLEAIHKLCII